MGCAKSLELATDNESSMKAKKQASEGTSLNDHDHCKGILDYDLRVCTWNIPTLNRDGASAHWRMPSLYAGLISPPSRKCGGYDKGAKVKHTAISTTISHPDE